MKRPRKERIRAALLARLSSGTHPHAILLTGPRGSGKGELALWIARAAVCENGADPCGRCPACRSFATLGDLDLLVLRPIDRTLWIDRERAEHWFPDGIGEAFGKLESEGFLLGPLTSPAGRPILPVRLDPGAIFKRGRGSPRLDRAALEARIEGAAIEEGAKGFLREIARPGLSLEWYLSTVGIGLMTGADDGGTAARAAVIPFLGRRPASRRRKVVVIEEADRMTEEAENALLKTLEEPPPDSLLLLTSARRASLLDTIRSRCEEVRVPPLTRDETMAAASRYFSAISPEEWEALVLLGEGVPAQAAELDLDRYHEEREGAEALLRAASEAPLAEYLLAAEAWAEETEEEGEDAAARRLSIFLVLSRETALRAVRSPEGGAELSARADRLFAAAHSALRALVPGTNLRLLLEEFAVRLRRGAGAPSGVSR